MGCAYDEKFASHGSVFATSSFKQLIAATGLVHATFAYCRLGSPYQKYTSLYYTPEAAASSTPSTPLSSSATIRAARIRLKPAAGRPTASSPRRRRRPTQSSSAGSWLAPSRSLAQAALSHFWDAARSLPVARACAGSLVLFSALARVQRQLVAGLAFRASRRIGLALRRWPAAVAIPRASGEIDLGPPRRSGRGLARRLPFPTWPRQGPLLAPTTAAPISPSSRRERKAPERLSYSWAERFPRRLGGKRRADSSTVADQRETADDSPASYVALRHAGRAGRDGHGERSFPRVPARTGA